MRVDVVPSADAVAAGQLAGATVLVVDVLRASTTMIAALANGCAGIVPVPDAAEARRRASAPDASGALLAGERRGEPIPGFDLGNSPLEVAPARVGGRLVVLTTSNGTRALLAARHAPAIGIAAFVNLSAAGRWAADGGRDVVVLCAGQRGRRSPEDHVCAGLLVERVLAAAPAGRRYAGDLGRLGADAPWARHLAASGRGGDVAACLALDTTALVPRYLPSVDKVVAGNG